MIPRLKGLTILKQIGNGAGSAVFKARDDQTGEELAVKSVTPEIIREIQKLAPSPECEGDPRKLLRLYQVQIRNEWRIGHRLTNLAGGHIGIPRMHRLVVRRNALLLTRRLHLLMDFVAGNNLRNRRDFSIGQLVSIYRQAADILRFLHQHDVVHADMKPHHIIVNHDLKVQLLDLGLACHRQGHARQVAGSPDYMAPEQLAGAGVDERTDVFGLGATMFWALTGRPIRPSLASLGVMDLQTKTFETSVRKYNAEVPEALEEIVLRSCALSRRARLTLSEAIARLDRLA